MADAATAVVTHGYTLKNGRHAGMLITRVPVSYLKWMVNAKHTEARYAQAELDRRGTVTPTLEVSGHAIDRASQCCLDHWRAQRQEDEGLHAWLVRVSTEALAVGTPRGEKIIHAGMRFVFERDGVWPVLKTVMRDKEERHG